MFEVILKQQIKRLEDASLKRSLFLVSWLKNVSSAYIAICTICLLNLCGYFGKHSAGMDT